MGKRFPQRLAVAIDGKHARAFLGEPDRGGAAVAPAGPDAAGAGDERDPLLESFARLGHDRGDCMAKPTLGKLAADAFGMLEIPRLSPGILDGFRALVDLAGTTSDA